MQFIMTFQSHFEFIRAHCGLMNVRKQKIVLKAILVNVISTNQDYLQSRSYT